MRVIYIISIYEENDGASQGLYSQIEIDEGIFSDYLIVASQIESKQKNLKIVSIKDVEAITRFIDTNEEILLHYFKARNSCVLFDFFKYPLPNNIRLITTCVQSPSYKGLWLSPYEIKKTNHFVFIDKSSYNNPLISFIPSSSRSQIYCSSSAIYDDFSYLKRKRDKSKVVFGRGSSLDKCPRNMFEVFDKIDLQNKVFRIVGIPDGDNWVRQEASRRNNIEIISKQPIDKWKEICNTFDVFLYQLPEDSYASIDATLGLAMLLKKPCVYMGAPAPKERFIHGENGFVASSIDEMAYYATILGRDEELREKIGSSGRESSIRDFTPESRRKGYLSIYKSKIQGEGYKIPLKYYLSFYCNNLEQTRFLIKSHNPRFYNILRRIKKLIFK